MGSALLSPCSPSLPNLPSKLPLNAGSRGESTWAVQVTRPCLCFLLLCLAGFCHHQNFSHLLANPGLWHHSAVCHTVPFPWNHSFPGLCWASVQLSLQMKNKDVARVPGVTSEEAGLQFVPRGVWGAICPGTIASVPEGEHLHPSYFKESDLTCGSWLAFGRFSLHWCGPFSCMRTQRMLWGSRLNAKHQWSSTLWHAPFISLQPTYFQNCLSWHALCSVGKNLLVVPSPRKVQVSSPKARSFGTLALTW